MSTVKTFCLNGSFVVQTEAEAPYELSSYKVAMAAYPQGQTQSGACRELRCRVNSAITEILPTLVIPDVVGLNVVKVSTHHDLPLALAIICSEEKLTIPAGVAVAGELGLAGDVRTVRGLAPAARYLSNHGITHMLCPVGQEDEVFYAGLIPIPVGSLGEARLLCQTGYLESYTWEPRFEHPQLRASFDFSDIKVADGSTWPRAVEIAAAGNHALLLTGRPGSGKTMLARRMAELLDLDPQTQAEATDMYSQIGLLREGQGQVTDVPFRAPHHTISDVGIIGGGSGRQMPGDFNLAHGGVMFLDDLPEFRLNVIEQLDRAHRDGQTEVHRKGVVAKWPSRTLLVGAACECPCGHHGTDRCVCKQNNVDHFRKRLGKLSRSFDMVCHMDQVKYTDLETAPRCEATATIKARVQDARRRQQARQGCLNGDSHKHYPLRPCRAMDPPVSNVKDSLYSVARTIADLAGMEKINGDHMTEAESFLNPYTTGN